MPMSRYTDNRGLLISEHTMRAYLEQIGKTEQEVVDFLGKDIAEADGAMFYFLQMLAAQKQFYAKRSKT